MPTVLVADDDADHLELMSLALSRAGHRVVPARDAETAMSVLLAGGIDAALIDVRMPGESGIDLCRRLRAEPATAVLPVVLVSADVSDQRILTGLYAGADDFVTKPFHRAEICTRIENLLLRKPSAAQRSSRAAQAALLAARGAGRSPAVRPGPQRVWARRTA